MIDQHQHISMQDMANFHDQIESYAEYRNMMDPNIIEERHHGNETTPGSFVEHLPRNNSVSPPSSSVNHLTRYGHRGHESFGYHPEYFATFASNSPSTDCHVHFPTEEPLSNNTSTTGLSLSPSPYYVPATHKRERDVVHEVGALMLHDQTDREMGADTPQSHAGSTDSGLLFVEQDQAESNMVESSRIHNRFKSNLGPTSDDEKKQPYATGKSQQNTLPRARQRTRKCAPDKDPENIKIKKLRCEARLQWGDIAQILNAQREKQGRAATLTDAAVYGRFVRNAPRIAKAEGDKNFDVGEWMHLHKSKKRHREGAARNAYGSNAQPDPTGHLAPSTPTLVPDLELSEAEDELLKATHEEISQDLWNHIATKMNSTFGKFYDPEALARRFNKLQMN